MAAANPKESWRIRTVLGLAVAFLAVGGALGALDAVLLPALLVTLAAVALVSAALRAWADVALALLLAAAFLGARWLFPDIDDVVLTIRTAAISAFILLHAVLLIGPWSWWNRAVMRVLRHRRHMGVAVFLLAELHATLVLRTYYNGSVEDAFAAVFTFFGFTAAYIFFFLAVTSHDWLQKHVRERTWQLVHLAMVLGYAGIAWWALGRQRGVPLWALALPAATVVYGLLLVRSPLTTRLIRRVWGWKQLHAMIYAAYVMVVAHVWSGVVAYQGPALQAAFWALVAFAVGSHAVGLALRWWTDREARERPRRLGKNLDQGGTRYLAVAPVDAFRPGVGQKFFVAGNPVAVFKIGGRFLAVSNLCAHQKGPLYKGHINAAGHLECPWHGWEYSVEDGCGPPAFRKDCIPFYPTQVRDGLVYVAAARAPLPPDVPRPSRSAGDTP